MATATAAAAGSRLTLAEALDAARQANAMLPVAALGVQIAGEQRREAEAARRVRLALDGDFIYAPPNGYDPVVTNSGEERLQLTGAKPIYDGGAIAAGIRQATAHHGAAGARYRQAVREVDYDVRTQFAELLAADDEVAVREEAVQRLERYRSLLESRQQAGQALTADISRTVVQIASAKADVIDAEARRDAAAMNLNKLMGRPPETAFEPAPLPEPSPPTASPPAVSGPGPDVEAARLDREALAAALDVARAEPKPHLELRADAGLFGSDTSHLVPPDFAASHPGASFGDRLQRDLGYSVSLNLTWPLTSFGGIRARIAEARIAVEQAGQVERATASEKDLQSSQARKAMEHAYRQFHDLAVAQPRAHDSVLEAESRYFGGAGTTLEVLDALDAATSLAVRKVQSELVYRQAEALALRWEGVP